MYKFLLHFSSSDSCTEKGWEGQRSGGLVVGSWWSTVWWRLVSAARAPSAWPWQQCHLQMSNWNVRMQIDESNKPFSDSLGMGMAGVQTGSILCQFGRNNTLETGHAPVLEAAKRVEGDCLPSVKKYLLPAWGAREVPVWYTSAADILGTPCDLAWEKLWGGSRKIPKTHTGPSLLGLCSYRAQRAWWLTMAGSMRRTLGKQNIFQRCFFRGGAPHASGMSMLSKKSKRDDGSS